MQTINMFQAKTNLSRLVEAIELGEEREIIIARNGHPVARLVPITTTPSGCRIGIAKGLLVIPDDIDTHNVEVAQLFLNQNLNSNTL